MQKKLVTEAERLLNSRHQNKRRTKVIRGLALLVVVATISALIMPAVTMSNEVECGLEEHIHTEKCYAVQEVEPQPKLTCTAGQSGETLIHTHDEFCYDSQGNLICTLPEVAAHIHGDECYQERRTLICQEESVDPGHQHDASCYSYMRVDSADSADMSASSGAVEYICGMREGEGAHHHTDQCYPQKRTERLVCARQESEEDVLDEEGNVVIPAHQHTSECYEVEMEPVKEKFICTLEESEDEYDSDGNLIHEGHHHDESCWLTGDELCFQEGCHQHESEGHQHTDECIQAGAQESIRVDGQGEQWEKVLICQEEEREPGHVHTDGCYEIEKVLVCRTPELEEHTHSESCYDENGALICGREEIKAHQHTAACFTAPEGGPEEAKVLICGKEEHTHTDLCYVKTDPDAVKYYCGLDEHTHSEAQGCYFESGALKCTVPEHRHTDECLVPPSERPEMSGPVDVEVDRTFTHETDLYRMTIHVTGTAVIPSRPVMVVEEPEVPMAERPAVRGFLSLFASFLGTASATDVEIDEPEAGAAAPEPTAVVDGSQESYGQEDGGKAEASEAPDPDRIEFSVDSVDRGTEEYQRLASQAEASGGESGELEVFCVVATLDGVRLDLSRCMIKVEVELIDEAETGAVENGGEGEYSEPNEDEDEYAEPTVMSVSHTVRTARAMGMWAKSGESGTAALGSKAEVSEETVDNASVDSWEDGEYFAITRISQPKVKFEVQFYANLQLTDSDNGTSMLTDAGYCVPNAAKGTVPFVDSSKKVPQNNKNTLQLKLLKLNVTGTKEDGAFEENNTKGSIVTTPKLEQLYRSKTNVEYYPALGDKDFNGSSLDGMKLGGAAGTEFQGADHYEPDYLVVGKKDSSGNITWEVDPYKQGLENIFFTNDPAKASKTDTTARILLTNNTVIRLVYKPKKDSEVINRQVVFYDYDITDGGDGSGSNYGTYYTNNKEGARDGAQGINSKNNYRDQNTTARLAFGNNNTKTGLGEEKLSGFNINMANKETTYMGCMFGLVGQQLNSAGQPVFNVDAPTELFGTSESGTGYKRYGRDNNLTFERVGDTYTLISATRGNYTQGSLDQFSFTGSSYSYKTDMWSNNFWPLDGETNKDPKNDDKVHNINGNKGGEWAKSDDGKPHNSYFGMSFSVGFNLPADYVGPLEYYFYGDDDMWVFLDGKLVCDIGGVHNSVGMYVNLWDHIVGGKDGERQDNASHTLTFFYTERGASGSTCWMQYTIPNMYLVPVAPEKDTADLVIKKNVVPGGPQEAQPEQMSGRYTFTLKLDTQTSNQFRAYLYNADGLPATDQNGNSYYDIGVDAQTFYLKHGQYLEIKGLPTGTTFEVQESDVDLRYYVGTTIKLNGQEHIEQGDEKVCKGTMNAGNMSIEYTNSFAEEKYQLPETGGNTRAQWYTMACVPFLAAGCLWYKKKSQGEGGGG